MSHGSGGLTMGAAH